MKQFLLSVFIKALLLWIHCYSGEHTRGLRPVAENKNGHHCISSALTNIISCFHSLSSLFPDAMLLNPTPRLSVDLACTTTLSVLRTLPPFLLSQNGTIPDCLCMWLAAWFAHHNKVPPLSAGLSAGLPHTKVSFIIDRGNYLGGQMWPSGLSLTPLVYI